MADADENQLGRADLQGLCEFSWSSLKHVEVMAWGSFTLCTSAFFSERQLARKMNEKINTRTLDHLTRLTNSRGQNIRCSILGNLLDDYFQVKTINILEIIVAVVLAAESTLGCPCRASCASNSLLFLSSFWFCICR